MILESSMLAHTEPRVAPCSCAMPRSDSRSIVSKTVVTVEIREPSSDRGAWVCSLPVLNSYLTS